MPTPTSSSTTPKDKKGLRGRFFIGTLDGATVCGKVEKQLGTVAYALRLWSWRDLRPQHIRVVDVASNTQFAWFNTLEGMKKAKAKIDRNRTNFGSLVRGVAR